MACNKPFSISGSGIGQVKSHHRSKKYLERLDRLQNGKQKTFTSGENGQMTVTKSKWSSTEKEKILNAEILQVLHIAHYKISFSGATDHAVLFQQMFPDSLIAASYKQSYTKLSYILKFCVADHLKKQLIYGVKGVPYTFKFDETTSIQIKNQYDGYLQYWSSSRGEIASSYCGSIFIGHCSHKDLIQHYHEFENAMELDSTLLLHLGTDGTNVNKNFASVFSEIEISEIEEETNSKVLNIGTCSLHPVHTSLRKGLKKLNFDFDEFFYDVHLFFKLLSAHREDYASLGELTNVVAKYAMKHTSTRWLSMKYVCIRLLEQLPNLKEYFLKFLPKTNQYNKLKKTERYQRIKSILADPMSEAYLSFCAFATGDFESFLLQFQNDQPMIHMLCDGMFNLLTNLMKKFIKTKVLFNKNGDFHAKENLCKTDVLKAKNNNLLNLIDIGTKAKSFFSDFSLIEDESCSKFRTECLVATNYLMNSLPFDVAVIKYLHHDKRNSPGATNGISNLALKRAKIPQVFLSLFNFLSLSPKCCQNYTLAS